MLKNLQKRNQGFTIVEVMIVLAIAGLIILVVLLAVPALQRNSRNTSIKNDASAVAGAINEFQSSNNGRMPEDVTCTNGTISVTSTSGTTVNGKTQGNTACSVPTTPAVPTEAGVINVALGRKCNEAGTGLATGSAGTNARAAAILYATETSGGTAPQCLEA